MQILKINADTATFQEDKLAIEEPMEIVLHWQQNGQKQERSLSITMRTPTQHDAELAVGFLFTEGIIRESSDVIRVDSDFLTNKTHITVGPEVAQGLDKLSRNFYTTSSCGVCGKTSLDAVRTQIHHKLTPKIPIVNPAILYQLPTKLLDYQTTFNQTGGIHASGLFDTNGNLLMLYEDVGRHNALDKLIGSAFAQAMLPLSNHILLVSGRASFELVQKALMAGIPILAAVGAPSTLAVELAAANGMTLVGFLKNNSLNVYAGQERIV